MQRWALPQHILPLGNRWLSCTLWFWRQTTKQWVPASSGTIDVLVTQIILIFQSNWVNLLRWLIKKISQRMAAPVTQLVSMPFLYNRYGDMRRLWVRASHAAQYDQWWIHIYVPSRRDGCNKRRHNFSQKLYHKDSWGLKCLLQFCDEAIAELCHKYPGNYLASHETSTFTKLFECWMLKDGYFWVIYYVIYSPVFIHNAAFIIYIWRFLCILLYCKNK